MIPNDFTVDIANWNNDADRDACCALREQVFIVEQNVPREEEGDSLDATSRHVLARDLSGAPIGTARLTTTAVIGRMAVSKDWRGRHVGAALLRTLIEQARALAYPAIELHAQTHAVAFYEKFGFAVYGDEFLECDIKHFHMRRELTPESAPQRLAPSPRPELRVVNVESLDQALAESLRLVGEARREFCIYTRHLDADLFDTEPMLEALKKLAIARRGASIRILVQQPRIASQRGHRLIALTQRLSSVFSVRTPTQDEDLQYASAFLLNDARGYYFRTLGNRYDGEALNYAPGRHAQLMEYFNQVWERSETSDELRQLAI
jgi:predicted GNAT family N-acyltransferase